MPRQPPIGEYGPIAEYVNMIARAILLTRKLVMPLLVQQAPAANIIWRDYATDARCHIVICVSAEVESRKHTCTTGGRGKSRLNTHRLGVLLLRGLLLTRAPPRTGPALACRSQLPWVGV